MTQTLMMNSNAKQHYRQSDYVLETPYDSYVRNNQEVVDRRAGDDGKDQRIQQQAEF